MQSRFLAIVVNTKNRSAPVDAPAGFSAASACNPVEQPLLVVQDQSARTGPVPSGRTSKAVQDGFVPRRRYHKHNATSVRRIAGLIASLLRASDQNSAGIDEEVGSSRGGSVRSRSGLS